MVGVKNCSVISLVNTQVLNKNNSNNIKYLILMLFIMKVHACTLFVYIGYVTKPGKRLHNVGKIILVVYFIFKFL